MIDPTPLRDQALQRWMDWANERSGDPDNPLTIDDDCEVLTRHHDEERGIIIFTFDMHDEGGPVEFTLYYNAWLPAITNDPPELRMLVADFDTMLTILNFDKYTELTNLCND